MSPPLSFVNFAYGSNMCSRRLRERTPSARPIGAGRLIGHKLMWHMAGGDGSAKCDILETGRQEDLVWGVLYEIALSERPLLDQAEGLGRAYQRKIVSVHAAAGTIDAEAYVALAIDGSRLPFDWYHAYVLAGAEEHGLPGEYLDALRSLAPVVDPDADRRMRNLVRLREAGLP